jgi:carboxymethylenebutenolidase
MGGGFALAAATRGFDASAPNYGQLPDGQDEVLRGACPVVATYGARDPAMRGAAAQLDSALKRLGSSTTSRSTATPATRFMNRHNVGPLTVVMRVAGLSYHHPSTEDAWRPILGFFDEHLRVRRYRSKPFEEPQRTHQRLSPAV